MTTKNEKKNRWSKGWQKSVPKAKLKKVSLLLQTKNRKRNNLIFRQYEV